MLKFEGCTFSAAGADRKAKVYGLTIFGGEDVSITNCVFDGTGYAGILNKGEGNLAVSDCEFVCGNLYNPVEGAQGIDNGNVTIEDSKFTGIPGNNFINFYQVKDGSTHTIKNCKFAGGTANNIIRLSNRNDAGATFNIVDCTYKYVSGTVDEYTGFILCQDYTANTGKPQDFSKYQINITNLTAPEEGSLVYVYEDGTGIIVTNYPAVTKDGSPVLFGAAEDVEDED